MKLGDITSFQKDHSLSDQVIEEVGKMSEQLYLYADHDIWDMLEGYVAKEVEYLDTAR